MRYIFLLMGICGFIFIGFTNYTVGKETKAYADRAQVAADAGDMHSYLKKTEAGMRKHNMSSGHSALIFKTPNNDMSIIFQSVNRLNGRLAELKKIEKTNVAYTVGLDDIRGTIRELDIPVSGSIWVRLWWLHLLSGFFALGGWLFIAPGTED